ncbi:hypothetical protein GGD54_002503 [Rhizobium tropici]|uniref:Uncharacterized protein n=1 Tax=Rhizobium tropici TaxID=398 RepID=A0ABR6QYT3_RHITR|nr:hypothetical protein [Rhizobium tropici]MBB5593579.1 hypothetical protein [Rhizobium tropici]MBB6492099.1 hypothetical protein [Rhizobium tropici]
MRTDLKGMSSKVHNTLVDAPKQSVTKGPAFQTGRAQEHLPRQGAKM